MKEILFEWNPWWSKEFEFKGIKREKLEEVLPWISRKEIIAILGVRRAGKTTLFYEIIDFLLKKNDKKKIFFIKADDDRVEKENLIDKAIEDYRQFVNPTEDFYLFIDEIQELKEWQKTLKRIYDLEGIKIFISGSNSSLLKEELGSLLAGRFSYFEIFPFSFREFLKTKNMEANNELSVIKNKNLIKNYLNEYIENGAFPEVALEPRKKVKEELIKFYFDSIFYRDVIKRKNIRNSAKMEKLVKYFLQNISNLATFSRIAKMLDLTTDSITGYVKALEEAYLIFSINLFEFSYKKQIINPKKIYCVDTGMRNSVGFNFSLDIGRLYENLVFLKLRQKFNEIYYFSGKNECDFIVKNKKEILAIQVCYDLNKENKEREINGLAEVFSKFKIKEGLVITENYENEEKIDNKKIFFIPLWKLLLS